MKRTALLSVAVLLVATSCDENPERPRGPLTGPSGSVTAAGASSTVCLAYGKELAGAQAQAAARPGVAGLQQRVDALNAVIADACR